jgi:hypothetical protein
LVAREAQPTRTHSTNAWRLAPRHDGEVVRWECADGRWLALTMGHGASAGGVLVVDWAGRCEAAASFEEAFELAHNWRLGINYSD